MKAIYDPETDTLRLIFISTPIEESDEDKPGIILHDDKEGTVVGMEILEASKRIDNPRVCEYAVAS
ncbi:MAG: DUF2283 domain-containing protein [Nitrolancea sp.]